jgi:hypothetical protein
VLHDTTLSGQVYGYDPDGDAITAQLVSGPYNGTLTFNADGTFTYTPNSHYVGSDTFTYTWSDGISAGNTATVTIEVYNNAPYADDGYCYVLHHTALDGQVYGFDPGCDADIYRVVGNRIVNATDPSGPQLPILSAQAALATSEMVRSSPPPAIGLARSNFWEWVAYKIGIDNVASWDRYLGDSRTGWFAQASNAVAGYGDTLSFGITSWIRRGLGYDDVVDYGSGWYVFGEIAGTFHTIAIGGAYGWSRAGIRGAGREFSHWIPERWGGPRSLWNGNYVSVYVHALSDPYRYRFMSRA